MNIDFNFNVEHGEAKTGNARVIILSNSTRRLVVSAPDIFTYFDFLYSLKQAKENSPYVKINRFGSFSPIRKGQAKWYTDGEHYYDDVCKAIWSARNTVYITDWWLSPELYLLRPVNMDESTLKNRETRLDLVLKSVADRGVAVMIIQYLEPTLALNNDSLYTKETLEKMSPNIKVQRHPS
jgi:phospholipase D1/2